VRKLRDELPHRLLGVEADLGRVRAHERAREDSARQARDGVALERLEGADRDLRRGGDLAERHAALLPRLAQAASKIHGWTLSRQMLCRIVEPA
jgi:hypothetical protein